MVSFQPMMAIFLLSSFVISFTTPAKAADESMNAHVYALDKALVLRNQNLTLADAEWVEGDKLQLSGILRQALHEAGLTQGRGSVAYKFPLPALDPGHYELKLGPLASAAEAWLVPLDDPASAQFTQIGKVATAYQEEIPFMAHRILRFWVKDRTQRWTLLVNLSNETRYRGGLWEPPQVSRAPTLSTLEHRRQLLNFLGTGAMLIMLMYQFLIFIRRTDDRGALALAAICLSIILRNAGYENFFQDWIEVPDTSWPHDIAIKMEYIAIVTAPLSCLAFLIATFRRVKYPTLIFRMGTLAGLVIIAINLVAPPRIMEQLLPVLQIYAAGLALCCLVFIAKAVQLKEEGSTLTLLSLCIVLMLGSLEVYLFTINKGVNISAFGAVIFVFLQSQVLARRFADAFNRAEHLSRELQLEVDKQTWQIRHILRHIPQGIGTIKQDLHLGQTYSDSMRNFFPGHTMDTIRFDKLICNDLLIDDNSRSLFPSTLETLIGESDLTWNANSHLLIQEARTRDNRALAFDWYPIVKDGQVDEVLVTVRDVSELKNLRQKNFNLDREFECYIAFSKLDRDHAMQGYAQLIRYCMECRALGSMTEADSGWSRQVLIVLHTMKGNARQLGLKSLAAALHNEEQAVMSRSTKLRIREQMLSLTSAVQRLEEHFDTMKSVLERIHGSIDIRKSSISIEEILNQQFHALWNNQERLGMPRPNLELSGPLHLLSLPYQQALLDVWLHLLTNSFDHGFAAQDGPGNVHAKPTIQLHAESHGSFLRLIYADNGRGIHIPTLRDKATQLKLLDARDNPAPEAIAALIFSPGFSTRANVSESSGRGIGMDAVKTLLAAVQVELEIHITPTFDDSGFHPFQLIMNGPANRSLASPTINAA